MRQPRDLLQLVGRGVVIAGSAAAWIVFLAGLLAFGAGVRVQPLAAITFATTAILLVVTVAAVVAATKVRRLSTLCDQLRQRLEAAEGTRDRNMDERLGALVVANERLLAEVRELRAAEYHLRNAHTSLEETTQKYARLSLIDPLTNLANRRKFDEVLELEWRRGIRNRTSVGLVLVDVDYFKLFNDTYGHGAGDDCLREISEVIAAAARRPGDLAARIGGEEFTVLLGDTGMEGAMAVAQQIQAAIEQLAIAHETTKVFNTDIVSVSVGVASMLPEPTFGPNVLFYRADEALYDAKQDGRNCIRSYDECANDRRSKSSMRTAPSLRVHESFGRYSKNSKR